MAMSKEEYLKRYLAPLSSSVEKKKKMKRSDALRHANLRIIDQDADIGGPAAVESEDEDLLPAVTVCDERPKAVQELEKFELAQKKWKKIGGDSDDQPSTSTISVNNTSNRVSSSGTNNNVNRNSYEKPSKRRKRHDSDSGSDSGRSSARDSDLSPVRNAELSRGRRNSSSDVDLSPKRRSDTKHTKVKQEPRSPGSDLSPPRRRPSSPDGDLSPPRRTSVGTSRSKPVRGRADSGDSDLSPPRRTADDSNPKFDARRVKKEPGSELLRNGDDTADRDLSPPRQTKRSSSLQHSRKVKQEEGRHSPSVERTTDSRGRPTKTLSGAKAGLRHGHELRTEMDELRRKEEEMFESLPDEVSGRGAEARVREGIRPKKKKKEPTEEEKQKAKEMEEKYKKWNRGLKQIEQQEERVADVLREIDKPVARHKDDVDMNQMLKEQELKEDPMYEYMQKKMAKKAVAEGKTIYPKYSGPMPAPNRFGIMPGYRWDGVDRSNQFETKLMSQSNLRKADEDEYYKWAAGTYE